MSQSTANPNSTSSLSNALQNIELVINNPDEHFAGSVVDKCNELHELGCNLRQLYQSQNALRALDLAILSLRKAVDGTAPNDPALVARQLDLALFYGDRFKDVGDLSDFHQAQHLGNLVLKDSLPTSLQYSTALALLSVQLGDRFLLDKEAALEWAQESIQFGKEALENPEISDFQRAEWQHNLSATFGDMFSRTGDPKDIDEAINHQQLALSLMPENSTEWAIGLYDLALCFRQRFTRLQELQVLQQAIRCLEQARRSDLISGVSDQVALAHHLSGCLVERFRRVQDIQDLEEAIHLAESALSLSNVRISEQAFLNDDLCIAKRYLSSERRDVDIIDEAIHHGHNAIAKAKAAQHPKLSHLHNLSLCYATKSILKAEGTEEYINKAIMFADEALLIGPDDHPYFGECLASLCAQYRAKYEIGGSKVDLENSIQVGVRALRHKTTTPLTRMTAGLSAAFCLAILSNWMKAAEIFEESLCLLPLISPRTSSTQDLQECLRRLPSAASTAASTSLKAGRSPQEALRILERSRGVIASNVIDTRSSVPFSAENADLYLRYIELRDMIALRIPDEYSNMGNNSAQRYAWELLRRSQAATDLDCIIRELHVRSEFDAFAGTMHVNEMMQLAAHYPIVYVNVSSVSSEAYLITSDGIELLSLPGLTRGFLDETLSVLSENHSKEQRDGKFPWPSEPPTVAISRKLQSAMLTLWAEAVEPVLRKLRITDKKNEVQNGNLPRICWIGSDTAAMLPFHAAGDHSRGSTANTISHVISSYAPSLKSLQHIRNKSAKANPPTPSIDDPSHSRLLVAAMPTTPGITGRLAVEDELTAIIEPAALEGNPITVALWPSKRDLLDSLPHCSIFHFAGHGSVDMLNPALSVLHLGRTSPEELSVQDLEKEFHPTAQIAYLSACSTAEAANRQLMDENIHLASAFMLSGFPSVIGTLWNANDNAAVNIAGQFYQFMRTKKSMSRGDSVARALHEALISFRALDENCSQIEKWAPFIHVGN